MKESLPDLNQRIAARIRDLRAARGFSLDALANQSGVSRSMISVIERAESSPTAVVLEKLAAGLNVTLSSLFDAPAEGNSDLRGPVSRRDEQPQWKDPASGYIRRNVSPHNIDQPIRITEVHFPPGARVTFDTGVREVRVYQQVWLLDGAIDVSVDNERYSLREGDCLAMQLDGPTMFHNPTERTARYVVVTARGQSARRR